MRKISFVFFLIIISLNISTQEFDEAYLDSLPESVREDIKERMDQQKVSEKVSYKRLSETDSGINKTPNTDDEKDDLFGSQFFNSMQTSFMPISAPNLDDTYVLDFGDVALAGGFLKKSDFLSEKNYPLKIIFCEINIYITVMIRPEF